MYNKTMSEQKLTHNEYQIGDVVRTLEPFGPNAAGSVGMVYEINSATNGQDLPIISVILVNGHDIGCFTGDEQADSLVRLGRVDLDYSYSSPGQLMADYRRGYFRWALEEAQLLSEQKEAAAVESVNG
jgi:hypothetical protein